MANQKIHEYPLERFVYGDDDYYDIDYWDGAVYQTAKILGSTIKAAMLSGIAISLTAPSAFIVGGSPVDGTGTLTLTAAGLANQYIRGDGTLATLPTSGGGGNNVNYYLNGGTAASVATYYQMSKTAVIGTGVDFSLAGNGLISQWLTDIGDPNVTEIPAGNWNFEMFFSASSAGGVPKFYVEILKYDGVTFTTIADNSITPKAITSGVTIDLYLTSVPVPLTPMLTTDRLAIRVYIVDSVLGRTITHHTQDSHLCQVITTFSSGLSSINGLTAQTQYLAVGTAGTDFAISSATDTHTFNLPTASATNRGALSSSNWSTFNGKQNQITLTTLGSGAATFVADTLNIPTPSGGTPAGITGQIQFNNGGAFGADSGLFWDNTNKRLGVGATPSTTARLDVRAQGALSTDIALRVRNSADTKNLVIIFGNDNTGIGSNSSAIALLHLRSSNSSAHDVLTVQNGLYGDPLFRVRDNATGSSASTCSFFMNGRIYAGNSTLTFKEFDLGGFGLGATYGDSSSNGVWLNNQGNVGDGLGSSVISVSSNFYINKQAVKVFKFMPNVGNFGVNVMTFGTSATNTFAIANGAAPTTSPADVFQQYSADIVAGNAAPHFRTENGSIVKLYQETTAIAASTFVTNTSLIANDTATFDGYTIGQVVKALRNLGILA